MRLIRLKRRRGWDTPFYVTFVSDEDYDRVMKYVWHASVNTERHVHAKTYVNRTRRLRLSHFIVGEIPEYYVVDHIDGNTLNNTRENLRIVTKTENQLNSYKHRAWETKKNGR